MAHRVLIVEEDQAIADSIEQALCERGHDVVRTGRGEDAFFLATTQSFGAMVLDLYLPGRGGLPVLQALRAHNQDMAVLVLSNGHDAEDRLVAQRCGADDYLAKPFAVGELTARLECLLRRDQACCLYLADLHIDLARRGVIRAEQRVVLTVREYGLLEVLLRRARQVVSRDTLLREVWKVSQRTALMDNVIDVHVSRLRRKIDLPGMTRLIHTVRGVGFLLTDRHEAVWACVI